MTELICVDCGVKVCDKCRKCHVMFCDGEQTCDIDKQ